jgi:hypothetical protein
MANKSASDKGGSKRPAATPKPSPAKAAPRASASAAPKAVGGKPDVKVPMEVGRRRSPWVTVLIVVGVLALLCICVFGVLLWNTGDSIMQILIENGLIQ